MIQWVCALVCVILVILNLFSNKNLTKVSALPISISICQHLYLGVSKAAGEGSLPEGSLGQGLDCWEEVSHPKSRAPVVLSRGHRECKAESELGTFEEQQ